MRFPPRIGVVGLVVISLLGGLVWRAGHRSIRTGLPTSAGVVLKSPGTNQAPTVAVADGTKRNPPEGTTAAESSVRVGRVESVGPVRDAILREFDAWVARFEMAHEVGAVSSELLEDGERLLRVRREIVRELIVRDPAAALAEAARLGWSLRRRLPPALAGLLEERVAGVGRFEVLCAQVLPAQIARQASASGAIRTFASGDRHYRAHVYGRRLAQATTERVALFGVAIDDELAVGAEPVRRVEADEVAALVAEGRVPGRATCVLTGVAAEGIPVVAQHGEQWLTVASESLLAPLSAGLAAVEPGFRPATEPPKFQRWSHGNKRLLYMRARFPDDLREPITEAEASESMRLANAHFIESSYNSLSLIGTVGPLVMLPQPKLYYAVKGPGALIADARLATRAAGIDTDAFDLDAVRFENVPEFNWAGLGSVGGKGVWLQSSGLGVLIHELGHNLGLSHANFWNTVVRGSPPPPPLPIDPHSRVGIDGRIGPGWDQEYGDPFDVMGGGGDAHFSGLHKYLLGWIPEAGLTTIVTNGIYRVAAHDAGVLTEFAQVLRVRKDAERYYWISLRSAASRNAWQANGVELHWNRWRQAIGSTELIDTTPGSGNGRADSPLVLGRTFVDEGAQVFITPISHGQLVVAGRQVPFFDVEVNLGPFAGNQSPILELEASNLAPALGEEVTFRAIASDPDGDALTYSWDLGDGAPGGADAQSTRTWTSTGDRVVRCEVTDRKGGVAARHVVVRVGNRGQLRISGQVIDHNGMPLIGARVDNGRFGTNSAGYADEYRWAYTDSDGRYTLVGLQPGDYDVDGELAGYRVRPLNFIRPLTLTEFTGVDVSFLAATLPWVSVARVSDGAEAPTTPVVFRISRAGPTNEALRVYFRLAGTAREGEDYAAWKNLEVQTNTIETALSPVNQVITNAFVDLGPGMLSTNVNLGVLADAAAEGEESAVVTLHYPFARTIITETATNWVTYPGWEIVNDNGEDKWFQTRVAYHLGPKSEAEGRIRDAAPAPSQPVVSLVALESELPENLGDSASFAILRTGRVPSGPLRIPLTVGGTATPGDDYEALPSEIVLPADVDALRIVVRVLDDRLVEGNETVSLALGNGGGYTVGGRTASVSIVDNDLAWVSVTATDTVVAEGASSSGGRGARVTFQRLGERALPLEIDYLLGGSATAGVDYVGLPGRVVIPAGESSVSILVEPLDDADLEGDETVEVQLGDSPLYNPVRPARAVVTIRDDEFPVVTVEASDAEAAEGGDTGEFLIRRTGSVAEPLIVRYRFAGSAVHQADFVASGDQVVLGAGQRFARILVTPIDDAILEDPEEEIVIQLLPDPAYTLGDPAEAAIPLAENGDQALAVGFALLSSRAVESRTAPELAVRISGNPENGPDKVVTVAWEVLGGSATAGTDYVLTNGTLAFAYVDPDSDAPLANRIGFIPLKVIDDLLPENDETILVRLRIAPTVLPAEDPEQPPTLVTNGVLDVYPFHTFTIVDDDLSEWNVTATNSPTREGSAVPARFIVRRTGRTNLTQSVSVFFSGLAAAGSDYVAVTNRIVLRPGQAEAEIPVVPIDDPLMEFRENVVLGLVDAPGGRLGRNARAEVIIDDDDGTIEFTGARLEADEGDGEARFAIRRTGDVSLPASALLGVAAGTATPASLQGGSMVGDFFPTNLTVNFPAGSDRVEVRFPLVNDDEPELPETVLLSLTRGSSLFPLGGQNAAVLTIHDDDALISPADTNSLAGVESGGIFVIQLRRSGPTNAPLSLRYETQDASARAGDDYAREAGTVTFAAGERLAAVQVRLLDDLEIEGDESFLLRLATTDDKTVGAFEVVIVDDDCRIEFATDRVEVEEDAGVVDVVVRRIGSPLNPVVVDWSTVSDTAVASQDFEAAAASLRFRGNRFESLTNGTGSVVFRAGDTNLAISVRIFNDAEGERDESFRVILANARADAFGPIPPFLVPATLTNVVVTIRDNEAPGRLDDAFQPGLGADAPVRALGLQSDGKVLVGGDFHTFDGLVFPRLARLHADGFVDNSFNPGLGFDGSVHAVVEEPNGRVFVGGTFRQLDGVPRPFLARLEPDGTPSTEFEARPDGAVNALATGVSGGPDHVYAGGEFGSVNGIALGGVARFSNAGELDGTFAPAPEQGRQVLALVAQPGTGGDRVLVGGVFANWAGTGALNLIRLQPDGSPDPSWPASVSPDGPVHAILRAADDSIYVAGAFRNVGGVPRAGVARLLPAGVLDVGFDPADGAASPVLALGRQGEGRLLIAGAFARYQDVDAGRFLRVLGDGGPDVTFFRGSGADDAVRAVVVQPDGAIVIGGDFTTINDRPRLRVARIHAEEKFVEGFVEFTQSVVTVDETASEVVLTVRRTGAAKGTAKVAYRTMDGTARAGADFVAAVGELEFGPGVTNRTVRVALRNDSLAEGNEAFYLVLTNAVGAVPGRPSTATVIVQDDEAAVAFEWPEISIDEKAGAVSLVVRRSGPLAIAARVGWRTEDGSAVAGEDYGAGSGTLEFAAGQSTARVEIPVVDDVRIEGAETFRVRLESASGVLLGSQDTISVSIADDDQAPTHYTLTVERSPGGAAFPGSGRFPTNSIVQVRAQPDRGFEFARWEGSVASADNPLSLVMDRNHVLLARFRTRLFLETFESGGFGPLPWRSAGDSGWIVTNETASAGGFSARSGSVRDGGQSSLLLERETPAGGGSFDFRTSSEAGWDYLVFLLNDQVLGEWSGLNGWQTFQFNVPAGRNRYEWRFRRDRTFGGALDAVWIDNLDLPDDALAPADPPRIAPSRSGAGCTLDVTGTPGRRHVLERSGDLRSWTPVASLVAPAATFVLADPECGGPGSGARFYRVRVEE